MAQDELEKALTELKRDVISSVLARRGVKLSEAGLAKIELSTSYERYRPATIDSEDIEEISIGARVRRLASRLVWRVGGRSEAG